MIYNNYTQIQISSKQHNKITNSVNNHTLQQVVVSRTLATHITARRDEEWHTNQTTQNSNIISTKHQSNLQLQYTEKNRQ